MFEPRMVTLEYVIDNTGESQKLDFIQDQETNAWMCVLEEDEMNRILVSAYNNGKLEDGDGEE